jgi:hypothetical protein
MKALASLLILAGAVVSSHAHAACVYPKAPEKLPDGATATKEEMVAAQKLVQNYNDDIKAYQDCLKLEHDDQLKASEPKPDKMSKDQKAEYDKMKAELDKVEEQKSNAAYDEAEALTKRFNEQIRAYNAKGKPKS